MYQGIRPQSDVQSSFLGISGLFKYLANTWTGFASSIQRTQFDSMILLNLVPALTA